MKTRADEIFMAADYYEMTTMRLALKKLIVENAFELVNGGDCKQVIAESHNPDIVFEILNLI